MSDVVIRTENLGKSYELGERERYLALRDLLARAVSAPAGVLWRRTQASSVSNNGNRKRSLIWALKNTNLEIRQGEVVGLLGSNGAGKSTLLKVLSRVTTPTTGFAEIRGRLGSLLEVGTGFHPELTGRENIYFSGAILGMSKREITRKFDEIVAFAEVEKFISTPVKHYSSGMYVRLAFSVAAHLEPEILFVDEVLAVGDVRFQKKCLGKMGQVSRDGRTIVFVSHNMAAIKALCSRALLIRNGTVAASGNVADVVDEYLVNVTYNPSSKEWTDPSNAPASDSIRLSHVRITAPDGKPVITVDTGAQIEIGFESFRRDIHLGCTIYVTNSEGVIIFASGHPLSPGGDSRTGFYRLAGRIPGNLLNAGRYSLDIVFGKDQRYVLLRVDQAVSFEVENVARGSNMDVAPGVVRPQLSWSHSFSDELSPELSLTVQQ